MAKPESFELTLEATEYRVNHTDGRDEKAHGSVSATIKGLQQGKHLATLTLSETGELTFDGRALKAPSLATANHIDMASHIRKLALAQPESGLELALKVLEGFAKAKFNYERNANTGETLTPQNIIAAVTEAFTFNTSHSAAASDYDPDNSDTWSIRSDSTIASVGSVGSVDSGASTDSLGSTPESIEKMRVRLRELEQERETWHQDEKGFDDTEKQEKRTKGIFTVFSRKKTGNNGTAEEANNNEHKSRKPGQ